MLLASLLTADRLRSQAGSAYSRGERYWKQRRVLSCEVKGDAIDGIVRGKARYQVRLFAAPQARLGSSCTCPIGQMGVFCKHAIALGLARLANGPAPTAPVATVPATSSRSTTSKAMFATRAELEAWAARHQVAHELRVVADVLVPDVATRSEMARHLPYLLARFSLLEVGSLDAARRLMTYRDLAQPVAEAAHCYLTRAAEDVRAGVAEEQRHRDQLGETTESVVRTLWSRLVELRAQLRANAPPRSRATRAAGTLEVDAKVPALCWREPTRLAIAPYTVVSLTTRLELVPATVITCACRAAACTHGLALIDAALDLLAEPARAGQARTIATELLRPPWDRALIELAAIGPRESQRGHAKPAPADVEVWWQLDDAYQTLTVAPLVKKPLKKGGMSAGTRPSARRLLDDHGDVLTEHDRKIAEYLVDWAQNAILSSPVRVFGALVGHPRVVTKRMPGQRVVVERCQLGFTAVTDGDLIRLEPSVGGAPFEARRLAALLEHQGARDHDRLPASLIVQEPGRCLVIDVGRDALRMWNVVQKHGPVFPPESHDRLLDRLARLEGTLPIVVPHELMGARIDAVPSVVVRLRLSPDAALELEPLVRVAPGAPPLPPGSGPRDVSIVRDGVRGFVRRELEAEVELVRAALAQLPIPAVATSEPVVWPIRIDEPDAALAVVAAVQQPLQGLEAEWVDDRRTVVTYGSTAALSVKIERKRDWFGVDGGLEVDGARIELAVLLDAARRQRRFVRVDDRRWIELSDVLRQRLVAIADRTFVGRELELSPGAVPTIRELEADGAKVEAPPAWQLMADRLVSAAKLRPKPPAALAAELRPYQVEGHAWLTRVAAWGAGACLADDMGLGKTVQTIAMLLDRGARGPALVLAPTSVTLNWIDELRRFAPTLRPIVYANDRACLSKLGKRDVLVVSYGLLVRDAAQLAECSFATLVADEAHALKNASTRRAKAARALTAEFRVALSGTPLENHVGELWSLFAVIFPGLLGSWEQFRTRFALPIERDNDPEARGALSRLLRPFLLRRTKSEVAHDLPARSEIDVPIALSAEETELYEDARLAAIATLKPARADDERQRFAVLAALTRLRLLASHPRLHDADSPVASSKMQRLLELLDELRGEGHRALVFSQFTSHLALVRAELERAGYRALYLDGSTPAPERANLIRRFQAGEAEVFLLSLKAGGTGINLTAADYVIHLDPWWNPAVEDQATDRAHRIGQTRPVTVYRLIARGTVEEQILAMHGDKRALVAGVLEGTDVAARLTTRDLLALLGGSGGQQQRAARERREAPEPKRHATR